MAENNHIDIYKLQATIPHWRSEERTSEDKAYQPFLTFTDRESYLAWQAEWKTLYTELSQRIRTLRKEWRAEGSDHDSVRHSSLFKSRALARAMLELRKASKRRAQELYQASKETPSAVA